LETEAKDLAPTNAAWLVGLFVSAPLGEFLGRREGKLKALIR